MTAGFVGVEAAVADFEHIRIVPVTGAGGLFEAVLGEADLGDRRPLVADIEVGAPHIGADGGCPVVDVGAPGFVEVFGHQLKEAGLMCFGEQLAGAA